MQSIQLNIYSIEFVNELTLLSIFIIVEIARVSLFKDSVFEIVELWFDKQNLVAEQKALISIFHSAKKKEVKL